MNHEICVKTPDDPSYSTNSCLIGLILRRLRQLCGVSQQDLAQRSQTDPSYLSHIERGNGKVSILKIQQVCDALDWPDDKLLHLCRQFEQSAQIRFEKGVTDPNRRIYWS